MTSAHDWLVCYCRLISCIIHSLPTYRVYLCLLLYLDYSPLKVLVWRFTAIKIFSRNTVVVFDNDKQISHSVKTGTVLYEKMSSESSNQQFTPVPCRPNCWRCISEPLWTWQTIRSHVLLVTTVTDNIAIFMLCQ